MSANPFVVFFVIVEGVVVAVTIATLFEPVDRFLKDNVGRYYIAGVWLGTIAWTAVTIMVFLSGRPTPIGGLS